MVDGVTAHEGLEIVVVGLNYAPETTGIGPYTTGFARHLAASGMDVTAVTGRPHYPEWRVREGYGGRLAPEIDQGVRVVRVHHPVPRDPTGPSRVWMEVVFALRAAVQVARRRPAVVVVVSPALLSLVPVLLLAPLLRFRVGVVVQDLYGAALAETGLASGRIARATALLERLALRRATAVAVIHEVFRDRLLADGLDAGRITVMPNWSHVTMPASVDRERTRQRQGWGPDEFIALHAGNMGVKQGLEGLVDVARTAQERGSRVRVVLLGDGSRARAIRDAAAGIAQVSILDPLPGGEFEAALQAADCLVLHEKVGVLEMSVPSKLTTYFTAGRPVVAATARGSGADSLVRAAGAGHVVEAGDPVQLLAAIELVAADADAARTFGENGRRYAAEHLAEVLAMRRHDAWVRALAGLPAGVPPTIRRQVLRRGEAVRGGRSRTRARGDGAAAERVPAP